MTSSLVSRYPHRTMIIWVTLLLSGWLALFSPLSAGWNAALATLAFITSAFACGQITRSNHARDHAARQTLADLGEALAALPAGIERRMPLVIAIGDNTDAMQNAFCTQRVRITDTAIWIRQSEAAQLLHVADALKRWRGGQGPDAVAWLIEADAACSATDLTDQLTRWRAAIAQTQRMLDYRLPVCVALLGRESEIMVEPCPWFGVTGSAQTDPDTLASRLAPRLTRYVQTGGLEPGTLSRAHRAARLDALTRWACESLWPALMDVSRIGTPLALRAFGVTTAAGTPAPDGPFARFTTRITALRTASVAGGNRSSSSAVAQTRTRAPPPRPPRPPRPRPFPYPTHCWQASPSSHAGSPYRSRSHTALRGWPPRSALRLAYRRRTTTHWLHESKPTSHATVHGLSS